MVAKHPDLGSYEVCFGAWRTDPAAAERMAPESAKGRKLPPTHRRKADVQGMHERCPLVALSGHSERPLFGSWRLSASAIRLD